MEADATWWLESPGGTEIGGSGFAATLRDYGRFGLFVLQGGRIGGTSILPDGWVGEASTPKVLRDGTARSWAAVFTASTSTLIRPRTSSPWCGARSLGPPGMAL